MTSIPLGSAFNPRDNALNLLRLVLASMVIFGHAAPLGGYELPRTLHLLFLEVAVDGFFGLSGFLITRSWDRRPLWGRFLWHRALRILPGFWACLVLTAFAFGPLGTWLSDSPQSSYWQAPDGPGPYIWNNFWLRIGQFGISSGPSDVPYPEVWNGSLWSLYWEFLCYLGIAALGVTGLLLGRRIVVLGLTAAVWLLTVAPVFETTDFLVGQNQGIPVVLRLSFMFLVGSLLHLFRERVPLNSALGVIAGAVFTVSLLVTSNYRTSGGVALVYFLIWLAITIPLRIGSTHDISYGVYIYAFPIQQTLAIVGWNRMGWFGYSLVSLALTLPLAWASWLLVERPVMSFKEWTPAWFARPRVDAWLASRKTAVVAVGFVGLLFAAQMVPVVLAAGKN